MATQRILDLNDLKELDSITKRWAKKTRSRLSFEIQRLGLVDKGKLASSFREKIKRQTGEVTAIQFTYTWYGFFHDVGANIPPKGNGVGFILPAKHWKAKAINPNIKELSDELGRFYANVAVDKIIITK